MSKKQNNKLLTPEILKQALLGAVKKLDPRYMIKNPVMFVVEIGFVITMLLTIAPGMFGETDSGLRTYNMIVSIILLVTVLFANFAESVAEGRGKAQAASLKKTQKDTEAHRLDENGNETLISSSELKKDDVVMVVAGEVIPGDGEVIEGIASVDESAITGESAPVVRESGGDFCSVTGGTTVVSDWLKVRITGADSPVMADSSTEAIPSMTSPSPGMTPPADTITTSPFFSSLDGTILSPPSASSRRACVSFFVFFRLAACAFPRPSATDSAKFANSTVTNRMADTILL